MKYRKHFQKLITRRYPETADSILLEMDKHYRHISKDTYFSSNSKNSLDKRLDFTAYFLSLIKTLSARGFNYDQIRNTCLEITYNYVKPKSVFHAWLKRLIPKLLKTKVARVLLKAMDKNVNRKGHVDGFLAKVITDKEETYGLGYGIDILECGICKLFKKHKAERYSSILCEVDNLTSSLAGLELVRNGTIANGADKCDFRFKRK